MKKFIALLLLLLCGCEVSLNNTPTKQAEIFLGRYQSLHKEVLNDLDLEIDKMDLSNENKEKYRSVMKKHYQDLEYKILEERIDGDKATVDVLIEVNDYSDVKSGLEKIISDLSIENEDEIMKRRLGIMKDSKKQIKYTISLTFTKKDNKWIIDPLTSENMDKINGIYTE